MIQRIPLLPAVMAAVVVMACVTAPAMARAGDACDALTARMIRATGASLAGRAGDGAVFRAADADRMSLACGKPRRMVFGAVAREPLRPYFVLIGLAGQGLTGARARDVEVLALTLHRRSLLTGAPAEGRTGAALLRCETGPREDMLADNLTVCVLQPGRTIVLRRRAGLNQGQRAG